jgi:3-hydroxybutyryl-CoA dehydratase
MALLPPGLHGFDGLTCGDQVQTAWVEVTPEAITAFATMTGDDFEIHRSDIGAQRHGFPARVAHGLLVLSLVEGLKARAQARFHTFAALGWNVSFRAPVFAGDQIRALFTVKAKRAAGPGKGLLTLSVEVENQIAPVLHGETRLMATR